MKLSYTTYDAGILQAKAYRKLRHFMQKELEQYDITMMQWALLGTIYRSGTKGAIINDIARRLDVEGSLVTNMVNNMVKREYVKKVVNPYDSRSKKVIATSEGKQLVRRVERELRKAMRSWLSPISKLSLSRYLITLDKIANLHV